MKLPIVDSSTRAPGRLPRLPTGLLLVTLLLAMSAAVPAAVAGTCAIGEGRWGGGPPSDAEHWTGGGDDLLLVAAGAEVVVLDIQTPAAPIEMGRVVVGHPAASIAVSENGQLMAVSDWFDNVSLVDISNRSAPVLRGSYAWPGIQQPTGMAFRGNHLYVAVRTIGITVLDISDADAPAFVANSDGSVTDFVFDVDLYGDYAYLAQRDDGVQIVDISDPGDPRVEGSVASLGGAAEINIVGDRAYVARGAFGFSILDLSADALAPAILGAYDTNGYTYEVVRLPGDRLAAADGFEGTRIFDISSPAMAVPLGGYGFYHSRLVALDERVFVVPSSDQTPRIRLMDFQNPAAPVELGHVDLGGLSRAVSVGVDHVLVANSEGGVVMLDSTNPVAPTEIGRVDIGIDARRVGHVNGYGVASAGYDGAISVIELQPGGPSVVATIDNLFATNDLVDDGTWLYVASGEFGGLRIYDMSNPLIPQFGDSYVPSEDFVWQIAVSDGFAYSGDVNDHDLLVIDVSNPAAPTGIGSYTLPGGAKDIAASGSHVYVGTELQGVRILQNDGLGNLSEIADIDVSPAAVTGVSVDGSLLYISAGVFSGLLVYDISNPAAPQFVEQHNTTGEALGVDAAGGVIAIAEGTSGASVFGCNPASLNNPPVAVGLIGNKDSDEGEAIFPLSVNPNFNDPDGQALTFSATGLPPGLSITVGSGVIQGSLDHFSAGSYSVEVTATDPFAQSVSQSFNWTVNDVNAGPVVVSNIPNQYNDEGDSISLDVHVRFSDPDGGSLRFEASSLPQGISIDENSGVISGTLGTESSGSYTVLVAAFDPQEALITQTFSWVVQDNAILVFGDGFE